MIATAAMVCIMCKHAKLKALPTGLAFQPIRETDAIFGSNNENEHCNFDVQWYTIAALASVIIGLILFILVTTRKCRTCRGKLFPNTVTVMLFLSDVNQYAPVKLCKTVGSIYLFKSFWMSKSRSNYTGKKIIVACNKDRLERSLYDFEWNYNTFTCIGHNTIER